MPTESTPVYINRQFSILESKYLLNVQSLYVDSDAIRINYQVTPPIPYMDPSEPGALIFTWWGYAMDNNQTNYSSCGGACGLAKDGQSTEGVLSLTPILAETTLYLDVTMIPERIATKDKCEFRVVIDKKH